MGRIGSRWHNATVKSCKILAATCIFGWIYHGTISFILPVVKPSNSPWFIIYLYALTYIGVQPAAPIYAHTRADESCCIDKSWKRYYLQYFIFFSRLLQLFNRSERICLVISLPKTVWHVWVIDTHPVYAWLILLSISCIYKNAKNCISYMKSTRLYITDIFKKIQEFFSIL